MVNLETYCTVDFLESIYDRINVSLSEFLLEEKDEWISDLYKFLHGNCTLITNISSEEIAKRSTDIKSPDYNPNFKKLWKNRQFVSYPATFEQMLKDEQYFNGKVNEIYLLSADRDFCNKVGADHGLICSCMNNMDKILPKLFVYEIRSILKEGKILSWDFLSAYRYPSNSAILADNYIFHTRFREQNILEVLRNIMPDQLNETYDLTIFTKETNNLLEDYNYLNEYLIRNLPYRVNLSIGLVELDTLKIHDRDILTNYCWYHSGAGFTLFKPVGNKIKIINNTTVFIFPVTHIAKNKKIIDLENDEGSPVQTSYFNALTHYKKIWRELPSNIGNQITFVGTRKNRLLD